MAAEDVEIRLGLTGEQETSRGLRLVAGDERQIGTEADRAGARARAMGATVKTAGRSAHDGLMLLDRGAKIGVASLGALTLAGTKWGLSYNAQVEGARQRFQLFTNDVEGLTRAVQGIDLSSQFNFGDLADAAALLGNSGVQNIPSVLQGIANAAAASGRGTEGLQRIALAIGQIQNKGRLSQEELNQILEAGGPGAQQAIQREFNLTAKQLQNLGNQGLDATKAIDAITHEWTSGRMAGAAKRQLQTLGGQWQLFTGNAQKVAGAATHGLAIGLERDVLPAASRAAEAIQGIFNDDTLAPEAKLRRAKQIIRRELGPVAQDMIRSVQDSGLIGELEDAFESAMTRLAGVAVREAPHVVKAFVDAWLGAGPWAKLVSGAWLAHKLGLDKGALELLRGGGKGGLGAGSKLPFGATPVWVVNGPGGSAPPGAKTAVEKAKGLVTKFGPGAAAVARTGLSATPVTAALAVPIAAAFFDKAPNLTQPRGRLVGDVVNGHDTYLGPLRRSMTPDRQAPIIVNPVVQALFQIDGRTVAFATADAQARKNAR